MKTVAGANGAGAAVGRKRALLMTGAAAGAIALAATAVQAQTDYSSVDRKGGEGVKRGDGNPDHKGYNGPNVNQVDVTDYNSDDDNKNKVGVINISRGEDEKSGSTKIDLTAKGQKGNRGGDGGNGGTVDYTHVGALPAAGVGVAAQSRGGDGGDGGNVYGLNPIGGDAGKGGEGRDVVVQLSGTVDVTARRDLSANAGVIALSAGGSGGIGGQGFGVGGTGGAGGSATGGSGAAGLGGLGGLGGLTGSGGDGGDGGLSGDGAAGGDGGDGDGGGRAGRGGDVDD